MSKPTILQTLLSRPSQTYTFPPDRDYHSTKAHMFRVASEAKPTAQKTPDFPDQQLSANTVMGTNGFHHRDTVLSESHVIGSQLSLDGQLDDEDSGSGSEDDIFYTPNTSPMPPSVRQLDLQSDSAIATRTPLGSRSTTTSISSNSLDGHSIFSLESSPLSDSTHITTPNASDTGHDSLTKPLRRTRQSNLVRTKQPSSTYTDEDWAKDVRWLAPTSASTKSSKRKSTTSAHNTIAPTSYYIAQLPPKIVPQPPPQPASRPRPRPKMRSKSVGITNHSTMTSMAALLEEEDEDRESAHRTSQGSLHSEERARTHSTSSAARQRTSNSLRRQNFTSKPLSRRKSRSLEHLPHIARVHIPDSIPAPEVSSLSSFTSITSYAPSIPSSGTPGYTSLTLPRAPQPAFTPNPNKRVSVVGGADGKIDLTRSGIAQTTMATVEVTKGLAGTSKSGIFGLGAILERARSRSVSTAKVVGTGATANEEAATSSFRSRNAGIDAVLSFTSYRRPPDYIPGGSVLVQVWAVAVDEVDAKLAGVVHSRGGRASSRLNLAGRSTSEREGTNTSPNRPGLFRSVSRKHKRSESDNPVGRSSAGVSRIEPDVGYIPGRSFVGRVLECGWDVSEDVTRKGEWVVGLLDVRKCGALQEFIVVDRHRVHRVPQPVVPTVSDVSEESSPPTRRKPSHHQKISLSTSNSPSSSRSNSLSRPVRPPNLNFNPPLTLEEYALLPLCGIFAYRAVRTLAYAFGKPMPSSAEVEAGPLFPATRRRINEHEQGSRRRVLVLRGHDGAGAIAVQMLVRRGWRVCVHASFLPDSDLVEEGSKEERDYMESIERRVRRWGAEEVVFDDGEGADKPGEGSAWEYGVAAVVRVIERLIGDGDVFDAVLDTVGGKEIWEASERLLRNTGVSAPDLILPSSSSSSSSGMKTSILARRKKDTSSLANPTHGTGQFTTLVGDTPSRPIPTAGDHFRAGLRSMKNTHKTSQTQTHIQNGSSDDVAKKGVSSSGNATGKVGYAWVNVAQDVDWEGEDVRDSLDAVIKMAMNEGVRPWVSGNDDVDERVVPFERTPRTFIANGPLSNGGTAVVKVVE
ncbi:hypothetical protein J3R30DRAFT_1020235 [Lentinula aciculospora]|uniref:Uncharacterized protein n=1 Tax=Lentinula aciculospora TaxID=153920 RepID=A0A9W9DIF8_9AGAR|nr:hypothetical protein J3R30DRAFT_1020235 [Lentinula aciculospora]